MGSVAIRKATQDDAGALLAIYRPVVEQTAISFEGVCPTEGEFAQRIESIGASHCWLVAEDAGAVAGYAYASTHRPRDAYRHSAETTVYMHEDHRGRGIGKALYERLFAELESLPYFHAFAGITVPNDGSIALHQSVGFSPIGTFPRVGFKFGAWHDVSWWYRKIKEGAPE